MTIYTGQRMQNGEALVSAVDANKCASRLDPGFRHVNHSPTGFNWGYMGSGPAQLAFAILLDHFNGEVGRALLYYQDFKEHVIALITTNRWQLTTEEIEAALQKIRVLRSRAKGERWHEST